ncbi:uncharacterized protein G2W53_004277 [Senna tora]|uniref:Uncharacterized protein n=1 Tax=Senna tora TaxID=362788 RepID=A0A835CH49_9FABA|nr:uncharacterized protein G2W53_004277 [Senna tora]
MTDGAAARDDGRPAVVRRR